MTPQSDQDGFAQFANQIYNWMLVHIGSCWFMLACWFLGHVRKVSAGATW
jgi:hypothetical protein